MRAALDIHRELLSLGVPHEIVRLPKALHTADDLPAALGLAPAACVVVRCYVTDLGLAPVAVAAGARPDPGAVLRALSARTLRVASADEASAATDFPAGLVSPLGLPEEVRLLADVGLAGRGVVYCPAGEPGVALAIRSADLLAATGARIAALHPLPLPRPAADATLHDGRQPRSGRSTG